MTEESQNIQRINFKLHLILFFITASLWAPIYNLICFLKLNELARFPLPEDVSSPKNSAIANFLLALTYIGLPFAIFRRFQLLNNYIKTTEYHLPAKKKTTTTNENDDQITNCLAPGKFLGFAIVSFLLLGILVTSITIPAYYIALEPSWGSNALIILFPIGFACFFTCIGFCVRTIKEEKKWIQAFNEIYKIKAQ
ncbi:MAG: hypothetical protein FK730_13750 [Asgard group archaeon]|nr:hypothetical protein [Asgard group archaeon]